MDSWEAALLIQSATTWAMVGVIWLIQVLVYPQLADLPEDVFPEFERRHQRRVVGALAVFAPLEILSALWLFLDPGPIPRWIPFVGGAILAIIWISTALFYAPIHGRLASGFDAGLHESLVRWNWLRTLGWTVRGLLVIVMVAIAL